MKSLLHVEEVSKSFHGLCAVDRVSFDLAEGAIAALIGPNGAGKTTLFNMIAGVFRPDAGSIRFDGRRIDGLRPDQVCHAGIGRTFQLVKPFQGLTVLENVIVGALREQTSLRRARQRAEEIVDILNLGAKAHLQAATLTLPDRKRLEVARALAARPRLLLLDEVMAGLRPTECDAMAALLRMISRQENITILLIEHVMQVVMALAQHVVVLNYGQVVACGEPKRIVRDPAVIDCYLGGESIS